MTELPWTLYTAPADAIDADMLRRFLAQQRRDRLFMESMTLELKRERHGDNVVRAVAALANTGGGIVLLGVDETVPDFDESPGVPQNAVTAVLEQCTSTLTPAFAPELIPVALPGRDQVVLVIRVDFDASRLPIVKGGQILIRQPGSSVQATHGQVLDLVARRTQWASGEQMMNVVSAFTPNSDPTERVSAVPDLRVRCATALYGREGAPRPRSLGNGQRRALVAAVGSSSLGRMARLASSHSARQLDFDDDERSARRYRAHADVADEGLTNRVAIDARLSGPQVAVALDFDLRLRPTTARYQGERPVVQRHELVAVAAAGVATLSVDVGSVVAGWIGGAPARIDDIELWVEAPQRSIPAALASEGTSSWRRRAAPNWMTVWRLTLPHIPEPEAALENLGEEMKHLYVDLGFDDEVAVVRCDVDLAADVLSRLRRLG
ncbi:ATP-binding protein [Cellulomonas sp. NTE-D12]|uniref:AlbA family DNA-binding domain-containing protein n=1 Tax=Cellulomonas sp. NTE-D12 TaxID=2962632 RepID=UPI0030821EA6